MQTRVLILALGLVVAAASTSFAATRTWQDNRGRKIQAELVRAVDGTVILLRHGKVVKVPFENLSPADQEYVRKELKG
jgi:hypothetical protein